MIKIKFPNGSIGMAAPFSDHDVDDLIKTVSPLLSGDVYVKFMDDCLEHIQEFLDWENNNKELVLINPLADENIFTGWSLLRDPFQNYEQQSVRATRCSAGTFGSMRRVTSESKSLRNK